MTQKNKNIKYYNLHLPVFKQGDDMAYCMDESENHAEALLMQAENYQLAADICKRLASVAVEHPDFVLDFACTHCIQVSGPSALLQKFVDEGILYEDEWDEEEEDEEWDDEFEEDEESE